MTVKDKLCAIISLVLGFAGLLFLLGFIATRSSEAADDAYSLAALPATLDVDHRFRTILTFTPIFHEGRLWGAVALFDDPRTKRAADSFELYDSDGDLMALGWFDRFGIERVAVDRGLLNEGHDIEGVFVSLLDGDAI